MSGSLPAITYTTNGDVVGQVPKLKGSKKLLQTLHRMSSSQLTLKPGKFLPSAYSGSVSCVSLGNPTSPHSPGCGGSTTPFGSGYYTAPTSALNTPGLDKLHNEASARIGLAYGKRGETVHLGTSAPLGSALAEPLVGDDYFSIPVAEPQLRQIRYNYDFWGDLPSELQVQILTHLKPKQIVRCSGVSKAWRKTCFDGQLWADLDTAEFYRDITAKALANIITNAGPFLKDLNLRGCIQLSSTWKTENLSGICRNLENMSLEGSRIDRSAIHSLLSQNTKLVHVNLSGMDGVNNQTMKIIAQNCPKLELLNISWCKNVDSEGLIKVVQGCELLKDLRAGEVQGFGDEALLLEIYNRNTIERLILQNCDSVSDSSFKVLFEGIDVEVDIFTGRPAVLPRRLRHLDISRCRNLSDVGVGYMAGNVPFLEGLQLSKCHSLTDNALISLLPTLPSLTHLDLEEVDALTNACLQELARSPCRHTLKHLNISYCEELGDVGMLPVIQQCKQLRNLDLDNTRISDLVLVEAAQMVHDRHAAFITSSSSDDALMQTPRSTYLSPTSPRVGLRMVVYDCQHVTWTGIREVMSRNAELRTTPFPTAPTTLATTSDTRSFSLSHPLHEIITLKCFYGYQPTVAEHTRRILRGDFAAASRLEYKWAEYMMATEEAGGGAALAPGHRGLVGGYGERRRRRRAREARMMHADEQVARDAAADANGQGGAGVVGRRRRARSGPACLMM